MCNNHRREGAKRLQERVWRHTRKRATVDDVTSEHHNVGGDVAEQTFDVFQIAFLAGWGAKLQYETQFFRKLAFGGAWPAVAIIINIKETTNYAHL